MMRYTLVAILVLFVTGVVAQDIYGYKEGSEPSADAFGFNVYNDGISSCTSDDDKIWQHHSSIKNNGATESVLLPFSTLDTTATLNVPISINNVNTKIHGTPTKYCTSSAIPLDLSDDHLIGSHLTNSGTQYTMHSDSDTDLLGKTWSIDLANQPSDNYSLLAQVYDDLETRKSSLDVDVRVDSTNRPLLDIPADNSAHTGRDIEVSGMALVDSEVHIYYTSIVDGVKRTSALMGTVTAGSDGMWSYIISGYKNIGKNHIHEGSGIITATAVVNGTESEHSDPWHLKFEYFEMENPTIEYPTNGLRTTGYDLSISGTSDTTTTDMIELFHTRNEVTASVANITVSDIPSYNGRWSVILFDKNQPDHITVNPVYVDRFYFSMLEGKHIIYAVARPSEGASSSFMPVTFEVDTTAPDISITSPKEGDTVGSNYTVSGTLSDDTAVKVDLYDSGSNTLLGSNTDLTGKTWSIDLINQKNGHYSLFTRVYDELENGGFSQTIDVTVDSDRTPVISNSAIATTIKHPQDGPWTHGYNLFINGISDTTADVIELFHTFNNVTRSFANITVSDIPDYDGRWQVSLFDTKQFDHITVDPAYNYSRAFYDLEGSHIIYAIARNLAGLSSSSMPVTLEVDTTPPDISITSPKTGVTVGSNYTVSGTLSDDTAVKVDLYDSGSNTLLGSNTDLTGKTWSIDLINQKNGDYSLVVVVYDEFKNGGYSQAIDVTVTSDSTPIAPTINHPQDDIWTHSRNLFMRGTSDITADVIEMFHTFNNVTRSFANITVSDIPDYDGRWYVSLSAENQPDYITVDPAYTSSRPLYDLEGSHTIYAVARNSWGSSPSSIPVTFKVDRTVPDISITFPKAGDTVGGNYTVSGTLSDDTAVKVDLYNGYDDTFLGSDTVLPGTKTWSIDLINQKNGDYSLQVHARDEALNVIRIRPIDVTVDSDSPSAIAPTIVYPYDGLRVHGYDLSISGTSEITADVIELFHTFNDVTRLIAKITVSDIPSYDGRWHVLLSAKNQPDYITVYREYIHSYAFRNLEGDNTIYAVAEDLRGTSSSSMPVTFEVDVTGPYTDITSPKEGDTVGSNYTVSGTLSDDTAVEVRLYSTYDDTFLGSNTDLPGNKTWSIDLINQKNGDYYLHAIVHDELDNLGFSQIVAIKVNSVSKPVINTPANNSVHGGSDIDVTGTAPVGSHVHIYYTGTMDGVERTGVLIGKAAPDSDGTWSFTMSGYKDDGVDSIDEGNGTITATAIINDTESLHSDPRHLKFDYAGN